MLEISLVKDKPAMREKAGSVGPAPKPAPLRNRIAMWEGKAGLQGPERTPSGPNRTSSGPNRAPRSTPRAGGFGRGGVVKSGNVVAARVAKAAPVEKDCGVVVSEEEENCKNAQDSIEGTAKSSDIDSADDCSREKGRGGGLSKQPLSREESSGMSDDSDLYVKTERSELISSTITKVGHYDSDYEPHSPFAPSQLDYQVCDSGTSLIR